MTKWISVKDKLPDKNGRYILLGMYKVLIKSFYKGYFYSTRNVLSCMSEKELDCWFNDAKKCRGITHWMPLPAPPEDSND